MNPTKKCPICDGEFEQGLLSTTSFPGGSGLKVSWGSKYKKFLGKLDDQRDILSYRCKNCGYIESYAN